MAAYREVCVIVMLIAACSSAAEQFCTNQWEVNIDGVDRSELTVHHSSTFIPGRFIHLVWHWHRHPKLSGTLWLSQHQQRRKYDGGFIAQSRSLFDVPASFTWTLRNGSLAVTTHGDSSQLSLYPPWSVSICDGVLVWGVTADKDLYITLDQINETRSLDEAWAVDARMKRQAEFPTEDQVPRQAPRNSTLAIWWRRFIDSIRGSPQDGRPRSWMMDLTDLLFKLMFSGTQQGQRPPNIPANPDAEIIPGYSRDVEPVSNDSPPSSGVPRLI